MSFMSKLTKEFEGLKSNLSDKPKKETSERGYGAFPANLFAQPPPA
ncbi:hypothetical protein IMZ48_09150 [Candidatus Bathyarchaeota archaeon]|nr:hypothetical protein [Candidatus Bathyarchaeota archaeon]